MPYDLTSEWNVVNKTSKQKITRDIEIRNKLTVTRGEETKGLTGERKRGKGRQGTCIKDLWTKPKVGRIEGGRCG